ncbi:hypothetical protein [Mycoplasma sp. 613B]
MSKYDEFIRSLIDQKEKLEDNRTFTIKFPISLHEFYLNMLVNDDINGYSINSKIAKCLKIYMLKDHYGKYNSTKLKNLSTKIIRIDKPIIDYSKKREFIKQWIIEQKIYLSLHKNFTINEFEELMRQGEILVSE